LGDINVILDINAYHRDSSASVIKESELIATTEEERFKRANHGAGFPLKTIKYCLQKAKISLNDVDYISINHNPKAKLYKKVLFALSKYPSFSLF